MKTRAISTNSYAGDSFKRIEIQVTDRWIPIIGVYKARGVWENDTNGRTFKTLAEAKKYAIYFYNNRKGIKQ